MSEKSKNTVLYILLFLGFVIIVREHIGGRSLWVDEAMLALNMNRSFSELLKPLYYNQTSPILFLFAARFFTLIFGISDYSLRILPLISGLGSLYVFFLICRRFLGGTAAIVSMLLFILSYRLIYYANEFKQYSTDMFFSLLFFYFFLDLREEGFSLKKGIVIALIGLVSIWFSFSAIVVIILFAILALYYFIRDKNRKGLIFIMVSGFLWALNILAEYVFVYRRNPNFEFEPLLDYWVGGFMPFPPANWEEVLWLPRTIKEFFIYVTNTDTILTGRFPLIIDVYAYIFIILFMLGIIYAFKNKRGHFSLYVIGIIFLALCASALGKLPFGDRLTLYLVPLVLLVSAYGICFFYNWLKKAHRSVAVIFLVLLFFLPAIPRIYHLIEPTYKVELKSVINYYLENKKEGDKVYVYIDQYTYYPPQFYFYTGKNFDFTNMDGSRQKELDELKREMLGYKRVWTIGDIGELRDYGRVIDSYKIRTLASRWPFKFLRDDIIYLNKPNAEIKLYDFSQYELQDFISQFYRYGYEREPIQEELDSWVRDIVRNPGSIYELAKELLVENKEFESRYSDKEFIEVLYWLLLGRGPDVDGLNHWLKGLQDGSITRTIVIDRIMKSQEFRAFATQKYRLNFD